MVNSWLFVHSTTKPSTGDANQGPPPIIVNDERPSTVPKASIHLSLLMSSTEHLRVQLDYNIFVFMPRDAFLILYDRHKNLVKDICSSFPKTVVSLSPSRNQANFACEGYVSWRKTNWDDIVLVEDRSVEVKKSHVVTVGLGQHVSEIWMNDYVVNFVRLRIQWLFLPILCVVLSQVYRDFVEFRPMYAVRSGSNVPMV